LPALARITAVQPVGTAVRSGRLARCAQLTQTQSARRVGRGAQGFQAERGTAATTCC